MPIFAITIQETNEYEIEIEADDDDEAQAYAMAAYTGDPSHVEDYTDAYDAEAGSAWFAANRNWSLNEGKVVSCWNTDEENENGDEEA